MPWCVNPCTDLKTSANLPSLKAECGGCTKDSSFECYPGSPSWPTQSNPCRVIALGKGAIGRFGQSSLLYNGSAADLQPFQRDGCLPPSAQVSLRADCADVESTARLRDRGWVVLRGLMPAHEARSVAASIPVSRLCTPQLMDCRYSLAQMRRLMPTFVSNLESTLASWEASGLAAASGLGDRVRLWPEGTGRPVQVTTDSTFAALEADGIRRYPPNGVDGNFHVDSSGGDGRRGHSHRMWVLLRKEAGPAAPPVADVRDHANLCVVSTSAVDACDAPQFRAAIARHDPRPEQVFKRLACCPSLDVGDVIFYREDVVHGTQDSLADRLGMSITLESTDPPPLTPLTTAGVAAGGDQGGSGQGGSAARSGETKGAEAEDVRCAHWAAAGLCAGLTQGPLAGAADSVDPVSDVMRCLCGATCAAAAVSGVGDKVGRDEL